MVFASSVSGEGGADRSLAAHRFFMRLASAAANAFFWVFVFQYFATFPGTIGRALVQTLLLYALCQTITLLLTPLAARGLRHGMRRGIVYGVLLLASGLVYTGTLISGLFPRGTAAIGIFLGAYRAFYRVPYAVERAAVRHVARASLLPEIILALVPLFAGAYLSYTAFGAPLAAGALLFAAGALALVALVPLVSVPNVHERFSWNYRDTFRYLFSPENRDLLTSSVESGMGNTLLFFALPLSVFFISGRSYLVLGAVFSMTLLLILVLRTSVRRVVVEQYADNGAYVDEYTALKEMGMACGRLALALALVVALGFWAL